MNLDFNASFFALFGLEPGFDLDKTRLAQQYRELQAATHPDRFATASDQERRLAVQGAARINEAYNVLSDPLQRGFYLLELAGVDAGADQHTTSDGVFLMQQMELRERLEEVGDASDPLDELDTIRTDVRQQEETLYTQFRGEYDNNELDAAQETLKKIQFFNRLKSQLEETEARLEDELF